jgi:hypothetical protein
VPSNRALLNFFFHRELALEPITQKDATQRSQELREFLSIHFAESI